MRIEREREWRYGDTEFGGWVYRYPPVGMARVHWRAVETGIVLRAQSLRAARTRFTVVEWFAATEQADEGAVRRQRWHPEFEAFPWWADAVYVRALPTRVRPYRFVDSDVSIRDAIANAVLDG